MYSTVWIHHNPEQENGQSRQRYEWHNCQTSVTNEKKKAGNNVVQKQDKVKKQEWDLKKKISTDNESESWCLVTTR